MYRIIWDDNGLSPPGHFQNLNSVDNRPVTIDADKYELETIGGYLVINFFKEDVLITTLFRTPVAVVPVADIQE